jgi:steroid delta-isomerase-like uncharacterized protein
VIETSEIVTEEGEALMPVAAESSIAEFVELYGAAWNSGNLDAIMALHADETSFCLHTGEGAHKGREAVRAAFADSLRQMPDLHFASRRVLIGEGFFVHEMTMSATLDRAAAGGDLEAGDGDPSQRKRVDADVVDVITLRDGVVASKDTYVDALEMQRQLAS